MALRRLYSHRAEDRLPGRRKAFLADKGIAIAAHASFKGLNSIFIRDPDRYVIECDAYPGDVPASRLISPGDEIEA